MATTDPIEIKSNKDGGSVCESRRSEIGDPAPNRVPSLSVKTLGMILDASLIIKDHISSVDWSAFYLLQLVKQLVPYLTHCNLSTVTHAMDNFQGGFILPMAICHLI